jgi:hypothetical protein
MEWTEEDEREFQRLRRVIAHRIAVRESWARRQGLRALAVPIRKRRRAGK